MSCSASTAIGVVCAMLDQDFTNIRKILADIQPDRSGKPLQNEARQLDIAIKKTAQLFLELQQYQEKLLRPASQQNRVLTPQTTANTLTPSSEASSTEREMCVLHNAPSSSSAVNSSAYKATTLNAVFGSPALDDFEKLFKVFACPIEASSHSHHTHIHHHHSYTPHCDYGSITPLPDEPEHL